MSGASRRRSGNARVGLVALWLGLVSSPASGQERVFQTFGPEHGLEVPPVWALAQDSVGFIWIGAEAGLFRFDGAEIRRWAPAQLPALVMDVAVSPGGRVTVMTADGRLHHVEGPGARAADLPWVPTDTPRRSGRVMAYDETGTLWTLVGDSIWALGSGGAVAFGSSAFGGESPRGVTRATRGALVLTGGGLWRVTSDADPSRLHSLDGTRREVLAWATEPEPGRILALVNVGATQTPRVVEVVDGEAREVPTAEPLPEGRAIQLRERNGTIWVAQDRFLVAVRPGERPELLGTAEGFESGGPMLVDREGSLWVGSFVGLHQYPEPDTRIWVERQGLPSRHTRFVARSGTTSWIMTWNGPAFIEREETGWRAVPTEWDSRSHICTSRDGTTWTGSVTVGVELRGSTVRWRPELTETIVGCAAALDEGAWLGTAESLFWIGAGLPARRIEPPFPGEIRDPRPALLHDRSGRVWVGAGRDLCHARADGLGEGAPPHWSCVELDAPSGVLAMVELDEGRLWAAAGPGGLLEYDGVDWVDRHIDGVPTQSVFSLRPSPRGGIWLVGDGLLMRVRGEGDDPLGVVETLGPWHGLKSRSAGDLAEDPGGDLWLATNQGAAHVPAGVRFAAPPRPPVALVEGRVDGRPVSLDGPLVLRHDRNRLELRFAALSFRDRAALRHQVRLSPDEPWTEAVGEPLFRWVDLSPGTYHAEYRASRDGLSWSTTEAGFTFRVLPPWYATRWFLAFAALAAFGLAALVYRARVGYLLDLERQRTRIATDLHDQVGSGLASVGILSGVMAADGLSSGERTRTAREIAEVAEELGHSLSDIVWALDPQTSSLEELGARLAEHGERLFPDEAVRFHASLPPHWPQVTSSVAVRRNLLLIGLEALHNAARHAGARKVTLRIAPRSRGEWELEVRDDGRGLAGPTSAVRAGGGGRGLPGMARRAEAIGAAFEVDSGPGAGTTIRVRFRPREEGAGGAVRALGETVRGATRMIMRRR